LKELVENAKEKGFVIEIFTNGTLLDKSTVGFFKEMGVSVAVSIYSHKAETHDSITRMNGSYERTLRSIKLLQAAGVPVRCGVVAMEQNEKELGETCAFLACLGILERPPDPIRPSGRAKKLKFWPENYGRARMQTKPAFIVKREIYEKNRSWNSCWMGKAAVTPTGDVLPCVFARNQVAGNVRKQSLNEIIRSEVMLKLWGITNDQVETCKDCEYRYICQDCRPWAAGISGNLLAKSPRCTYDPYKGEWGNGNLKKSRQNDKNCDDDQISDFEGG
jgi:radical SAM protein with 4Fe4S-binding SPASM domain